MQTNEASWPIEREIVLTRVIDAPRELVFRAWTEEEHVGKWFGPRGFACKTRSFEMKVGGMWRFDFVAPNGHVYDNRMVFLEISPPERLVMDHGSDKDDDPEKFRVIVTFDEQSNKKTVVTLRQLHPTRKQRDEKIAFGAVEYGGQTLDKLAEHLAKGM